MRHCSNSTCPLNSSRAPMYFHSSLTSHHSPSCGFFSGNLSFHSVIHSFIRSFMVSGFCRFGFLFPIGVHANSSLSISVYLQFWKSRSQYFCKYGFNDSMPPSRISGSLLKHRSRVPPGSQLPRTPPPILGFSAEPWPSLDFGCPPGRSPGPAFSSQLPPSSSTFRPQG